MFTIVVRYILVLGEVENLVGKCVVAREVSADSCGVFSVSPLLLELTPGVLRSMPLE